MACVMSRPFCKVVLLALLLQFVLQTPPSAGAPAIRTLSVDEKGEQAKQVTPAGGARRGRGRYDYVYECAKCDEDGSTDIGATVYAYDG